MNSNLNEVTNVVVVVDYYKETISVKGNRTNGRKDIASEKDIEVIAKHVNLVTTFVNSKGTVKVTVDIKIRVKIDDQEEANLIVEIFLVDNCKGI